MLRYLHFLLLIFLCACEGLIITADEINPSFSECPQITKAYYQNDCLEEIIVEGSNLFENTHVVYLKADNQLVDKLEDVGEMAENISIKENKLHIKVNPSRKWTSIDLNYFNPCQKKENTFVLIEPQFQFLDTVEYCNSMFSFPRGLAVHPSSINSNTAEIYIANTGNREILKLSDDFIANEIKLEHFSGADPDPLRRFDLGTTTLRDCRYELPIDITFNGVRELFVLDDRNYIIRRLELDKSFAHNFVGNRSRRRYTDYASVPQSISGCDAPLATPHKIEFANERLYIVEETPSMIRYIDRSLLTTPLCSFFKEHRGVVLETSNDNIMIIKEHSFPNEISSIASYQNELYLAFEKEDFILELPSMKKIPIPSTPVDPVDIKDITIGKNGDLFFVDNARIGYFNLNFDDPKVTILKTSCGENSFFVPGTTVKSIALHENSTHKTLYLIRNGTNCILKIKVL